MRRTGTDLILSLGQNSAQDKVILSHEEPIQNQGNFGIIFFSSNHTPPYEKKTLKRDCKGKMKVGIGGNLSILGVNRDP